MKTVSFPYVPPPPPPSLVGAYYLYPTDARSKFLHNHLLCNCTVCPWFTTYVLCNWAVQNVLGTKIGNFESSGELLNKLVVTVTYFPNFLVPDNLHVRSIGLRENYDNLHVIFCLLLWSPNLVIGNGKSKKCTQSKQKYFSFFRNLLWKKNRDLAYWFQNLRIFPLSFLEKPAQFAKIIPASSYFDCYTLFFF